MKLRQVFAFLMAVLMLTATLASCAGGLTTTDGTAADTTTDGATTTEKPNGGTTTTEKPNGGTTTTEKPNGGMTDPVVDESDWLSGYLDTMPTLVINTKDGAPIVSKTEYISGSITVNSTEDAYNMKNAEIEIRGRGNNTWTLEKKSYRIKFAEKTNLLGQGAGPARSWTLLAVHCDQSMLRTAAAFTFASKLPGIDYSSSVRFVRLLLNGSYQGVYQVSEQMQVQEYRVNVDDTVTDGEEIGFLLELDQNVSSDEVKISDGWGNTYVLKSDYYDAKQLDFITDAMFNAFGAVTTGDQEFISEYIDLESVVDAYIVEELFKNLDVGWGSFYMYRDIGGKLHFGPLWDFDLAAGNADPDNADPNFSKPQYLYVGDTTCTYRQSSRWFKLLCEYDWFNEMVKERWFAMADIVNEVPTYVRRVAELYSEEFDENFTKWQIFGHRINREPAAIRALKSHDAHAEYLAKWLEQRISWMNDYYNGKVSALPDGSSSSTLPTFSGGKGSQSDPFIIATAKDFYELTNAMLFDEKFTSKYFLQTADIDMRDYPGYNGIGKGSTFAGTYNANGHSITVKIEGSDECIFPYVTGTVMNLVTYGSITNTEQAAGITRSVRKTGEIINCASYITLSSPKQAVGIAASNQDGGGTILGCFFGGVLEGNGVRSGAINYFVDGYGGTFGYNYYLNTAVGKSKGNETAVKASEYATVVNELNDNLSKLDSGVDVSLLCQWKLQDGKMVLVPKA